MTTDGENISYLVEHGMSLEDIQTLSKKDITIEEMRAVVESRLARGLPIAEPPGREPGAAAGNDRFFSYFKTLDEFEEEEARWIIPGWIPEGQITLVKYFSTGSAKAGDRVWHTQLVSPGGFDELEWEQEQEEIPMEFKEDAENG